MNRLYAIVIVLLLAIIGVLVWLLLSRQGMPDAVNTKPLPQVAEHQTAPSPQVPQSLSSRVKITSPLPNASVAKTFTVSGEAPGAWYFEASFPVQVRDKDGNKIGQVAAQAKGDWQTEGQVLFTAQLVISGNYSGSATLVLLKDNPSGMPENDDSVSIPITIK